MTFDPTLAVAETGGRRRTGRRWFVIATVAWALVVAGLGIWAVGHTGATAREQTTISQALSTADRAVADVVQAARSDGADVVAALTGYNRVGDCRVTSARSGARWERAVLLFVAPAAEPALLDRIAAGLPRAYHAQVRRGGSSARGFSADAGDFVAVRGGVVGPGQVRLTAETGCRSVDRPVREPEAAGADRSTAEAVLARLGVTATGWRAHAVPCRAGGTLWTVEAAGPPGGAPPSLAGALGAAGPAVLARPEVYAYRSGPVDVAVRRVDDALTVTATSDCR